MTQPTPGPFRVSIVVVVDRPELRGQSYVPVAPGTRALMVEHYETQAQAVQAFDAVVRGCWDFASEYARSVQVDRLRSWASPRTIRRRVERTREETEHAGDRTRRLLQVAAVRRAMARGSSQPEWLVPLAWRHLGPAASVSP